jgi:phospholipid/cholesterol/gamma-HCH transport system substrate-binding protein
MPVPAPPAEGNGGPTPERFRFRHVNAITGTFVLVVVALLVVSVVWTGRSQRWFQSNVPLRIILPEAGAAGIRPGSEVYFLGTRVGSISDLMVDATGRMEARASMRRDFFRFVRADSSAVVKRKFGVAGDAYFEITRGEGLPLRERNAAIHCEELPGTVETAIEEVRQATLPVLQKLSVGLDTWNALGTKLATTQEHLDQLITGINELVAGVAQGKGTAGEILTDSTLAEDAQQLLTQAKDTMTALHEVVADLKVAVLNVQHGTTRLPEFTGALADEAKDLPGLVRQTQISMRELERLIEAMQRHWLVRKLVDHAEPAPVNPAPEKVVPDKVPQSRLRSPKRPAR